MRFLLGPAGSGKTFDCLSGALRALTDSPEGPPLLLVAPRQSTAQLERQLLARSSVQGYTRLHILSLERLAYFVFDQLHTRAPELLDEEGRSMVLRALLSRKRADLKLFRASARLTGFAQRLSSCISEFQRHQITPPLLNSLAQLVREQGLACKLHDLSTLFQEYLDWLAAHNLQDGDYLLQAAAQALNKGMSRDGSANSPRLPLHIENVWVDGFAEWAPQELELLAALMPHCARATLTFCLDRQPVEDSPWLSHWSVGRTAFERAKERLRGAPNLTICVEVVARDTNKSRFSNSPPLQHLERFWGEPKPYAEEDPKVATCETKSKDVRIAACNDPEAEVTLAAREILRHVRAGGRYREVSVLVRRLDTYHHALQRIFARYEIPCFLDRREGVSHHPLSELTRCALRTVAFQWRHEDWFAALKTGLTLVADDEIDRLENAALEYGWEGAVWQKPLEILDKPELTRSLIALQRGILPPFQRLALALAPRQNKPTGAELAAALRDFWSSLQIEQQLAKWATADLSDAGSGPLNSIHVTVWEQMNLVLDNVELAFAVEPLPFREWLQVLEAGLANLSVGVIPPALDQVLLTPIDRSRNPDIQLAIVLGLNEGVFPAPIESPVLLTDSDRAVLEQHQLRLDSNARQQLSRERYLAYIACTRARQRLVLTYALRDANGQAINPSPFLSQLRQLFPTIEIEEPVKQLDWRESEHVSELISPLLSKDLPGLASLPALAALSEALRHFETPKPDESLAPELAARLYGPVLRTSVSRIEQFAACPFRFFVHSGLRAEDRKKFELDAKEQGNFQHEVLAEFHNQLRAQNLRWRDITPVQARDQIAKAATALAGSYRDGLFQASEQSRFMARILTESLQDFVETLVGWMLSQYQFDPVAVELPFGENEHSPAWVIALEPGARAATGPPADAAVHPFNDSTIHRLELKGRIDRIDIYCPPRSDEALCVVVDYKSSEKRLDQILVANGLQLQLLTYLSVLRHWPNPRERFGAARLVPAGVFYVNLRGHYGNEANRREALADVEQVRRSAYCHTGRFDTAILHQLDARTDVHAGDQFKFRFNKDGTLNKGSREALATADFLALLDSVETNLKQMGNDIFSGVAIVSPYRKGVVVACDQCSYQAACRLDRWTQRYRVLK